MPIEQDEFSRYLSALTDEALLEELASGKWSEEALALATSEALSRGLQLPQADLVLALEGEYHGDFVIMARLLEPTEAHLLKSYLESCNVPAVVADVHLVQAHQLLTGAIGGASVRVPADYAEQAAELLIQFKEGKFELNADAVEVFGDSTPQGASDKLSRRLKTFWVYSRSDKDIPVVVKKGFSWGAFIFGPLWFLVHGMWTNFLIVSALFVGANLYFQLHVLRTYADLSIFFGGFVVYVVIWFLIGKFANAFLSAALEDKGYKLVATVRAENASYAREEAQKEPLSSPLT